MPDHEQLPEGAYEPIFVARQPIFDRKQRIWGYELLFRHSGQAATALILDPDEATAKVIADGFVLAAAGLPPDKKLLINFPRNLLLKEALYALPSGPCVVEILETVQPEPEVVEALKRAKHAGYMLALDDFVGQEGFEPFLRLADIVKVEVLGQSREHLVTVTTKLKKGHAKLLAEKVEDKDSFDFLLGLGYDLFQGYYFSKPEIVPGRKISSSAINRLQLLQTLSQDDYEISELSKIISTDVSLTYRLLNYLNSPAFGLRRSIDTIHQALTILGSRSTRQWLMVVILSDLNPAPKVAELSLQSIQRGRFFELAAAAGSIAPLPPDRMFMLGLLSRLDALLGQYMEDILDKMPVNPLIKEALLGSKTPARIWLLLAEAMENAQWQRAERLLAHLQLSQPQAALLHARAGVWAHGILAAGGAPSP